MTVSIIGILLKYLMFSMSLFIIFGLIVLNDDSKWYEYIFVMLFMPFIVFISFVIVIIENIKEKKERNE